MVTVMGDYGDHYWISDLLLIYFGKLCELLGRNDVSVVYADSVDNAQMKDPIRGIGIEARFANERRVNFLFVFFRDENPGKNVLFGVFRYLRQALRPQVKLILIDTRQGQGSLTEDEKKILSHSRDCVFLSAEKITEGKLPDFLEVPVEV